MIKVNHLMCGYHDSKVLHDLNFTVLPNQKLMIIGPNGCGKTTLLKAMVGLIPYNGQILINGREVSSFKKKELSKKIALLSQMAHMHFPYTVYETVMQGRYIHQKNALFREETKIDQEVVLACLEMTGLLTLKEKSIKALSGGQLQRVFLARILVQEPDIILLDEPTNHLDLRYQLELMYYLDEWVKIPGRIVIGVVHDLNLALAFADNLMILKDGQIVAHEACTSIDIDLISETFGVNVSAYMTQALKKWER